MPAGYNPAWVSFDEAVRHAMRAASWDRRDAIDGVVAACKDGALASRYGDTHEGIDPTSWRRAGIAEGYLPGRGKGYVLIAIVPRPGEIPLPRESRGPTWAADDVPRVDRGWSYPPVELRREDMERLWPMPIGGIRPPHSQTQSGSSGANAEIEGPDAGEEPDSLPTARPPTPAGFRTTSAVTAEDACREYIAALSERPQNKETAFVEAREAVKSSGHLSRKAFERAWRDKAPSAWLKAGRRRKPR